MIEGIFEWIFTSLIYGTIAGIRAARRRRRFLRGHEVTFPGLVLEGLAVPPLAVGYLQAVGSSLRTTGKGSLAGHSVDIPPPVPGTPIDVTDIANERLDWRKHPTASYASESGRIGLACRSVDMKLLLSILHRSEPAATGEAGS